MRASPLLLLLLLLLLLPGCKTKGEPGSGGAGSTLITAPPAVLPANWTLASHDVGFSIAFPQGWQVKPIDRAAIEKFVAGQNENAWGIMNEQKAEVNLDKARGIAGIRSYFSVGEAMEAKSAEQTLVALREELPSSPDLEEAAKRWKDTLWGGSGKPAFKEAILDLPVGKAKSVSWTSTTLGFIDKTTVIFMVDGKVQYTLFFIEQALNADPIPVKEIMDTFRPIP